MSKLKINEDPAGADSIIMTQSDDPRKGIIFKTKDGEDINLIDLVVEMRDRLSALEATAIRTTAQIAINPTSAGEGGKLKLPNGSGAEVASYPEWEGLPWEDETAPENWTGFKVRQDGIFLNGQFRQDIMISVWDPEDGSGLKLHYPDGTTGHPIVATVTVLNKLDGRPVRYKIDGQIN